MQPDGGVLFVHAHPDDESMGTGGTIARLVSEGVRVDLVTCTDGAEGEIHDPTLDPDEARPRLAEIRSAELACSVDALGGGGIHHHKLGYRDSGMMGTDANRHADSFWQADIAEATGRLLEIVREARPRVIVSYDENGNYGHPDHIQVHRVGVRAAELAGTPQVLEATINRETVRGFIEAMVASGDATWDDVPDLDDPNEIFGMPDEVITTRVDVRGWAERKLAAMRAHDTQVGDLAPLLAMPVEVFREAMGTEFFIRRGVPSDHRDDDIFAGLDALQT